MNTLTELIDYTTKLIQEGGFIIGFLLIILEAFIPILPLGAFVTLNMNAFGSFIGILLSWTATVVGSFLMYLLCRYISTQIIYKFIKDKTKEKSISCYFLGIYWYEPNRKYHKYKSNYIYCNYLNNCLYYFKNNIKKI